MSNPVLDLKRLLVGRTSLAGRVLSVVSGVAKVATSQGLVEVPCDGTITAGGRVMVRDGRAVRVQGAADAPVHFV